MSAAVPFSSRLLSALKSLRTPPSKESVWIGPFDQLVSSTYALLKADALNFVNRSTDEYYDKVFSKITILISEFADNLQPSDPAALDNYISGIYFNAGFQRLTWAAERLVATFAATRCTCHRPPEAVKDWSFPSRLKAANLRLTHDHFKSQLPRFREMLSQFDGWDKTSYDPNRALSILRDQINPKKHSVYERQRVEASKPWTSKDTQWKSGDQMSLVVGAFELVCKGYCELLDWNLGASLY